MAESKLAHSTEARSTNIVIFGKSGTGKSALGNMLLGSEKFKSVNASESVTGIVQMESVNVNNDVLFVVDTPGFWDPENVELKGELEKCFVFLSPGFHVALYTVSISERFTPEDAKVLHLFESWFGEDVYKYLHIVFTKSDQLEVKFDTYLSKCDKDLKKVIDKCKFKPIAVCSRDNDKGICTKNWAELKDVIDKIKLVNCNRHYTSENFMKIEVLLQEIDSIILQEIKEREEKKFQKKLDEILLNEFPDLSVNSKFNPETIKDKRQQRRNELTLENEHHLHRLVRDESLKRYNDFVNKMTMAGGVVGGMVGAAVFAVAGPPGAAAGAAASSGACAAIFRKLARLTSEVSDRKV